MNFRFMATVVIIVAVSLGVPAIVAARGAAESRDATVNVATSDRFGPILVDSKGMTLYVYEKDSPGVSNCYGGCAGAWPPLTVADEDQAKAGARAKGKVAVIDRTDGSYQVTYNGMPLYTFASDKKPGDVTGQDVGKEGAKWYVVPPRATSVAKAEALSEAAGEQQNSAGMRASSSSSSY